MDIFDENRKNQDWKDIGAMAMHGWRTGLMLLATPCP